MSPPSPGEETLSHGSGDILASLFMSLPVDIEMNKVLA